MITKDQHLIFEAYQRTAFPPIFFDTAFKRVYDIFWKAKKSGGDISDAQTTVAPQDAEKIKECINILLTMSQSEEGLRKLKLFKLEHRDQFIYVLTVAYHYMAPEIWSQVADNLSKWIQSGGNRKVEGEVFDAPENKDYSVNQAKQAKQTRCPTCGQEIQ